MVFTFAFGIGVIFPMSQFLQQNVCSLVRLRSKVILQALDQGAVKAGISAASLSCIINVTVWISQATDVFDILYWINIDTKVKKKRFAFPFSAETVPALEGRDF